MDKVVHFEIPVDNLERAEKFYQDTFGWKMNPVPEMSYVILQTVEVDENRMPKEAGAINGGMMKRSSDISCPVITIQVSNLDDAVKKVQDSGGTLVREKVPVGKMGFAAYIKDTEGNIVGLWETKRP